MGDRYTALQWMMPQLARAGLLHNEAWARRQAEAACAMYADKDLHAIAMLLAVMHEHALDYLRQAPVLALGVAGKAGLVGGKAGRKAFEHSLLAYRFGPLIRKGTKLKSLLGEFDLPLPMRKILPVEIKASRANLLLDRLARMVDPSSLSQAIPEEAEPQERWLLALELFDARARHSVGIRALGRGGYAERFAWAAGAISRAIAAGERIAGSDDLVDFFASAGHPFNARWSWLRAIELSDAWHRDQATYAADNARIGFAPTKEFDYAPFPDRAELQGLEFVALRSVLDLREEGRQMRHCVGGYHGELAEGHRFYSIRRAGQRLATAQLVHTTAVQVKGPCNAVAKREVMAALGKFLKHAGDGAFPADNGEPDAGEAGE